MHLLVLTTLWVTALGQKTQPTDRKAPQSNAYNSPTDVSGHSFETCPIIRQEVLLKSQEQSSKTNISYKCNTDDKNEECACLDTQAVLYSFQKDKVIQSCCPLDDIGCSGCEMYKNGCDKCLGGFYHLDGECVGCTNNALFIDINGNTCAKYESQGFCKDGKIAPGFESMASRRYQHLSAQEACCVCGGGSHSPTPFEYRVRRSGGAGLIGEEIELFPFPQTAELYIASEDCNLAAFGLSLNGKSGVISGVPTHEEEFDITCEISARSSKKGFLESVFNTAFREYNTTLKVSMRAFGLTSTGHTSNLSAVDTFAIWDQWTYKKVYKIKWSSKLSASKPRYSMSCAPKTFVDFDAANGQLSLKATNITAYEQIFTHFQGGVFPKDPMATPNRNNEIAQSTCVVTANDDAGVIHIVPLKVFAYPPNRADAIDFVPTSAIRVTVGQPVISKIQLGYPNPGYTKADKIPGLLTVRVDCTSSTAHPVEFDILKGFITMQGLPVAIVNPHTGEVSGAPHVGLRQFMPESSTRSYFTIGCDVYAAVQSGPRPGGFKGLLSLIKASKKLVIQVDNDHCWVNAFGYTSSEGWYPVLDVNVSVPETSAAQCKSRCVAKTSCAGYMFVGGSKLCHFLNLAPPGLALKSTAKRPTPSSSSIANVAQINVDNCQIHQTCISVKVSSQAYLSGLYCPLLSQGHSEAHPVFEKPGLHAEDTFYIMPFAQEDAAFLPKHCTKTNTAWIIRKASLKKDDIVDVQENYLEMHGQIEACITSTILGEPEATTGGAYSSSLLEFHDALVHVRSINATDPQHSYHEPLDPDTLQLTQDKGVPVLPIGMIHGTPYRSIRRNTLLGTVTHYPYFDMKFEMNMWKQDGYYRSVFHFTKGCDNGPSCRVPAIWTMPGNRLHVRQSSSIHVNSGCDTTPLSLHKWHKYQITLYPQNNLQVKADGKLICNVTIGDVYSQTSVQLWASDNWYKNALADIRNLEYNSYIEAIRNKVTVLPDGMIRAPVHHIKPNTRLGIVHHHAYFDIKFEMNIRDYYGGAYRSVLRFTRGCHNGPGCRHPGFWIMPGNRLHVRQVSSLGNTGCDTPRLTLRKWQKYQITLYPRNNLQVKVEGRLVCNVTIGDVTSQGLLEVLASDNYNPSAIADIRNLEYNSYIAAIQNTVTVLPNGMIRAAVHQIKKNTMLGMVRHHAYFDLKFQLYIRSQDHQSRSVLHFTKHCDRGPSCRHPAIWIMPNNRISVRQASSLGDNSGCETAPVTLNKWQKYQITLYPQNYLHVKVDGKLICNVKIGNVKSQGLVELWASDKWHPNAIADIRNLEYNSYTVALTKYPTKYPTNSPTTNHPTRSFSPTVSIAPRSTFDSVPFADGGGFVKGASEQAKIELSPMAKSCSSPIVEEDGEGEKSSTSGNNGKAEDTPKVETERELGEIKGGENVDRSKVFMFDDPTTSLAFDYFLDPCECFFETWGKNEPVTEDAFETVNLESMGNNMLFNRLIPEAFKLWQGPHICDLSYLLENTYDSGSCAIRCADNALCKYFAVAETSGGMACIMFSACDHMLRVDTTFVATMYANYRPNNGNDRLCHLADPEACWAKTRRRAYLSKQTQPFGTCIWQSLHEQCDFARLIGDTGIQYCAPCTYMNVASQKVKHAMPKAFPHGAKLEAACVSDYQIITDRKAKPAVTCIDGEWRDDMGGVGLTNLQCAACVQVFDKATNGVGMVGASMEELLYINNRYLQMFIYTDSKFPRWIETEKFAIQLNAGKSPRYYSWAIELDRTTSMILSTKVAHNAIRCLSVDRSTNSATIKDHLSLQACPSSVPISLLETSMKRGMVADAGGLRDPGLSIADSGKRDSNLILKGRNDDLKGKLEGPGVPLYPLVENQELVSSQVNLSNAVPETVSLLPSQVMQALSEKDYNYNIVAQSNGWSCHSNSGILTQLGATGKCMSIYTRNTTDHLVQGTSEGFHISCPKGYAMTAISQNAGLYKAKCAPVAGMGQCNQVQFHHFGTTRSANGNFDGVYHAKVSLQIPKCPAHKAIVKFSGKRKSSTASETILKCCVVPFYSGVKLADDPMYGFKSYEGLYCPIEYDDLLRPKFRQVVTYGLSNLHSLVETVEGMEMGSNSKDNIRSFESSLAGKRRPTVAPTRRPTKAPSNYPTKRPTKKPTSFPTPFPTVYPTPFAKPNATSDHRGYISYLKTTNQWCLSYGPGTETCSSAHYVDHPLVIDWLAEEKSGVLFSVTPVSLLQGEGMTGAVGIPKARGMDAPEKPTLIKFQSEEPEYNQGCTDIKDEKFIEAQQIFAATSPCGIVASITWNNDGDPNREEGPGITHDEMNDCLNREDERLWREMKWTYGYNFAEQMNNIIKNIIATKCYLIPSIDMGTGGGLQPFYSGFSTSVSKQCLLADRARAINQFGYQQKMRKVQFDLAKDRYTDCEPMRFGVMRLLCDIHCLDDMVKSGATAVLRQVKASNENILTNIDMLMDYYAQLEMQKMTSEVNKLTSAQKTSGKKVLVSEASIRRLRHQIMVSMEKYLDLGKEITQPKDGRLSHEALMGVVKTNKDAQVALNNTVELLSTAQDSKTLMRTALEQIDARLARGYKEALLVHRASAGRMDNFGRKMLAKNTARTSVNLNISTTIRSHLHDLKSATLAVFHSRTNNIVNTVRELVTSSGLSPTGVLAWKIDMISNDIKIFRQEAETNDLKETIRTLALQWGTVHAHVVKYLEDAKRLTAMTQGVLSEIQTYTTCGRDSSFIRRATYDFNQVHERASKTLKNAWPEVVRTTVAHMDTYAIENVPRRSIHAAFASLRIPASEFASEYLTVPGIQKVHALLEKQLDGLPFEMTHQAVAMLTQVSFLRSSMITADFNPTQDEIKQSMAAYKTLSTITKNQVGALANNSHVLALFSEVLDAQLVTVAPAPGSCREIAFDRFNDPQAASFVILSSYNTTNLNPNVTSAFVVSPPLSSLLSVFSDDQEIEISKAFAFDNHAAASLLLRSVHVCAREQSHSPPSTRWTLQRAIDMPLGAGVRFCTGKACIGAGKGVIRVATRAEAEKAVDLTGSALLKLVRTAF